MRNRVFLIFIVFFFLSFSGCNDSDNKNKQKSENKITASEPDIAFFQVSNLYWDGWEKAKQKYGYQLNGPNHARFLVFFYPQAPDEKEINSIEVNGPDHYQFKINYTQPCDQKNKNGFIIDKNNLFLYQAIQEGFLMNGKYTITLTYNSGTVYKKSRELKVQQHYLNTYIQSRKKYSPNKPLHLKSTRELPLLLEWPLIDKEAYYHTILAEVVPGNFQTINLSRNPLQTSNIFKRSWTEPRAGLNEKKMVITESLKKNVPYIWQTQIYDSNRLEDVNLVIFMPFQEFMIR